MACITARRSWTTTAIGYTDIHIRATVTKRGSDLTIDLSDSHEQVVGFVNSSYPNMRSAVVVALAYLIDPHTPKNDGAFRPVEVIAKPGTVVWANRGRAGDAVHQSLLAGDHRGDHQGAGAGLSGSRDGGLGAAVPHRDPGARSAHAEAVHLAHVPGAAGRWRVAGGRWLAGAAASGRRRAASSSAAWR